MVYLQGTNGSQLWDTAFAVQAFLEVAINQIYRSSATASFSECIDSQCPVVCCYLTTVWRCLHEAVWLLSGCSSCLVTVHTGPWKCTRLCHVLQADEQGKTASLFWSDSPDHPLIGAGLGQVRDAAHATISNSAFKPVVYLDMFSLSWLEIEVAYCCEGHHKVTEVITSLTKCPVHAVISTRFRVAFHSVHVTVVG